MKGDRLIQIRGPESEGHLLMPGLVKFHEIGMIERPNIDSKWEDKDQV